MCAGLRLLARGWSCTCRSPPRRPGRAGRGQPHRRWCPSCPTAASSSTATAWCWPPTIRPTRWRSRRRARRPGGDHLTMRWPSVVDIRPRDRRRFKRLDEARLRVAAHPHRLTDEEVARFIARSASASPAWREGAAVPQLPLGEVGSHLIGYIGRINQAEKQAIARTGTRPGQLRGTEYIGKLGLEQAYERDLHGSTGFEQVETQRRRPRRAPPGSHAADAGQHLMLSVDIRLQALVERCSATAAARWWRSIRATARCWPSSASPPSTPTCSSTASTPEAGALNESIDKPLLNRAAARHLPAGLDLQAVHGDGGAQQRQARRQHGDQRPGWSSNSAATASGRRERRAGLDGHAPRHRAVVHTSTSICWPTRWAWTDPRPASGTLGLRAQAPASTSRAR